MAEEVRIADDVPDDDRLTIIVLLPAAIDGVNALLSVITEHWPDATLDVSGPLGWTVELYSNPR